MKEKRTAFTIVELLVVVAILAVLAAGFLGIRGYVKTLADTALTKMAIQLLSTGVYEFYDIKGRYPVDDWTARDSSGSMIYGARSSGGVLPRPIEVLWLQLNLLPQVRKIISGVPESMLMWPPANAATVYLLSQNPTDRVYPTPYLRPIKDPWGNLLEYSVVGGVAEILSYGPDGEKWTTDDISNRSN